MLRNVDHARYEGRVDACSASTIVGWAAEGDRPVAVTIKINGHSVANVLPAMIRSDVAATGRPILSGFRYDFATPLAESDDLTVVFPDGADLLWTCAKWGRAPASIDSRHELLSPTQTAFAWINRPAQQILTDPLTTFCGWFAALDNQTNPDFYVNGVKQTFFMFTPRPDVFAKVKAGYVTGWSLVCDLADLMTSNQHAITFEVHLGPVTLVKKHYRCVFPCPDAPPKSQTFFIHIPKTAGTSMVVILAQHRPYLNVAWVYPPSGRPEYFEVSQFSALSPTAVDTFDVVLGHYLYGFHKRVRLRRPYRYVTIMRDPFELIRSHYIHVKYVTRHPSFLKFETIYDALDELHQLCLDNIQCRYLAGVNEQAPVTDDDFHRAKLNIDNDFAFVGLTERMDDTLRILSAYFGLELVNVHVNRGAESPETEMLDMSRFIKAAAKVVNYDLELYDYVRAKFWGSASKTGVVGVDASEPTRPTENHSGECERGIS